MTESYLRECQFALLCDSGGETNSCSNERGQKAKVHNEISGSELVLTHRYSDKSNALVTYLKMSSDPIS